MSDVIGFATPRAPSDTQVLKGFFVRGAADTRVEPRMPNVFPYLHI